MMKFYGLILVIMFSSTLSAQINKGAILLGGQLSYSKSDYEEDRNTNNTESGQFSVSIGKAFKENTVVGISLGFSPFEQKQVFPGFDTVNNEYNTYNAGVFIRKYKNITKSFYFFSQLDGTVVIGNGTRKFGNNTAEAKTKQRGGTLSVTPGLSYQVLPKLQLELSLPNILGLQYFKTTVESDVSRVTDSETELIGFQSNFDTNSLLGNLGIGFRFIL
ncbi:MAG: outer membrane beta-barrel protein [Chitinophagaceae bacterium]|nr:outer membrane beta-barrel protein [Chitinophagaceae bacterium]